MEQTTRNNSLIQFSCEREYAHTVLAQCPHSAHTMLATGSVTVLANRAKDENLVGSANTCRMICVKLELTEHLVSHKIVQSSKINQHLSITIIINCDIYC